MKFSARAAIGGVGTAILCAVFPPITLVAVPAYGIACIAGKRRDRRLEDSSDSSESGDYGMNSMVRRSYENQIFRRSYEPRPYMGDIIPLPDLGVDISPEAVIARNHPRLAASILSKQIAASIIETGSNVIADTASEALHNGRDFSTIKYDAVTKERLFGRFTLRTSEFHGKLTIR